MRPDAENSDAIASILERKRDWHREQAHKSLPEKVRVLLELQQQELPLLTRQRQLRRWERPWDITP